MADVSGRFWLCQACGKHVPTRQAECRCGFSRAELRGVASEGGGSRPSSAEVGPVWFAVGPAKLIVMSLATVGLYQVYWFYQHWRRVRESGEDIWPLPRSIFGVIFSYSLFRRVLPPAAGAGMLAVAYGALCISSNLPTPYTLIALASVLPLVPVQRVANAAAERDFPNDDPNRRLTGLNWLAVAVALGFVGFVTYGLAVREKPTSLAFLSKVAAGINQRSHEPTDGVALQRAVALPGTLVYHFTVTTDDARQRLEERKPRLKSLTMPKLCREPLVKQGVSVRFVYADPNGLELATVDLSPRDCGF